MAPGMGLGFMNSALPIVWPAPDYRTLEENVRQLFRALDLDPENPLGRWIQPGMRVSSSPTG